MWGHVGSIELDCTSTSLIGENCPTKEEEVKDIRSRCRCEIDIFHLPVIILNLGEII